MSVIPRPCDLKIILLGDSAVGKSKLMERFLLDDYVATNQSSTYAVTVFRHVARSPIIPFENLQIDFWDTAGQERFLTMHPSYYVGSHACILVFDVTRKITYSNLDVWYKELVAYRGTRMPVIIVANKIDMDPSRASRSFAFVTKTRAERDGDLGFYFVSAADGVNVVSIFREAIAKGLDYKNQLGVSGSGGTFVDEVLTFIEEEQRKPGGLYAP